MPDAAKLIDAVAGRVAGVLVRDKGVQGFAFVRVFNFSTPGAPIKVMDAAWFLSSSSRKVALRWETSYRPVTHPAQNRCGARCLFLLRSNLVLWIRSLPGRRSLG